MTASYLQHRYMYDMQSTNDKTDFPYLLPYYQTATHDDARLSSEVIVETREKSSYRRKLLHSSRR
jgi:hypothetical protein